MFRIALILSTLGMVILHQSVPTLADNCTKCHVENQVEIRIPETSPIILTSNDKEAGITLTDAFLFHGHECPGTTTAFLAVRYGIKLLYGSQKPRREDLLILCPHPARGVVDLIDYVMKGDREEHRTWPIGGMEMKPENFKFTIIRKSECLAVNVQLKPALWPSDFFAMKRKQKEKKLTNEDWDTLHGYMKNIITKFPTMTDEGLFGTPTPYRTLIWGTLNPGEVDENIRKKRRAKGRSAVVPTH